jgi:DHA2 family multidrug resistance protein
LILFLIIELTVKNPLLNLRLLHRRNFGFGTLANFLLGTALYGSVFVLPLYLSQVQGYNAQQIGSVLAWVGLPQLFLIPLVPILMKKFDARLLVGFGFAMFAASNFMTMYLSNDFGGDQFFWPNIVRAVGQAVILGPLSAMSTAGIEAENAGSASALFNMMRNLGGAIGIASLQTVVTQREHFHSNVLSSAVSAFDTATRARIDQLVGRFMSRGITDPAYAYHEAVVAIGRVVRRQATIMAYGDAFFVIGAVMVLALGAILLLRKSEASSGAGAH